MSRLTDVLDSQTTDAKNETDFPTSKESNASASNVAAHAPSINGTAASAARRKPLKNKQTVVGKVSGVLKKAPSKNKRPSQKEKKASGRDGAAATSVADTNRATTDGKSARENSRDAVANERHEAISGELARSSFTALGLILNHLKTSQETGTKEILAVLSMLGEKINTNKSTAETSTGVSGKKIGPLGLGENAKRSQNQPNVENENNQCRRREQQVAVEDVTKCLDDRTDVNSIREEQPRPIVVNITFTGNDKHNDNPYEYTSKSDRCVCVSVENARNTNADKPDDGRINCSKTKSHSERTIQFSRFSKTDKINDDKADKFTKTNGEQKCVSASTSFKCSNRFSCGSLNDAKISKETKCEGSICDYLKSQPAPEWIKRKRESASIENQCEKTTRAQRELSHPTKNSKLFCVERIVNDDRDKNEIVYEITQESRTQGVQRSRNFNSSCPRNFNS